MELRQSERFAAWLSKLRSDAARAHIVQRLRRLELGNPGDVAPVGEGVSELRIHTGPGYRVYFTRTGASVVVLLCGGTKKTQPKDIREARAMASLLKGYNA